MKFDIYILILVTIFTVTNCSCEENKEIKQKLLLNQIDLKKIIQLEENDSTIINTINKTIFFKDYFAILEYSLSIIVIYDYYGKILKIVKPELSLSDTLKAKAISHKKDEVYITLEQAKTLMNEESYKKSMPFINHSFSEMVHLENDIIVINSSIKAFKVSDDNFKKVKKVEGRVCLIYYNLLTDEYSVFPVEYQLNVSPKARILEYNKDNNSIYLDCISAYTVSNKINDSLWSLAEYDYIGNLIKPLYKLPDELIKSELHYSDYPLVSYSNNELAIIYQTIPKIHLLKSNKSFELKNVSLNNYLYYKLLVENLDNKKRYIDSFYSIASSFVTKIEIIRDSLIMIDLTKYDNSTDKTVYTRWIQLYNFNGDLLNEYNIDKYDERSEIEYIDFIPEKDFVAIVRKNLVKGWYITFMEI